MFGEVWEWAGTFRKSNRNIGVDHYKIQADLRQLLGDVRYWIEDETYQPDEIAIRFHHRLVPVWEQARSNVHPITPVLEPFRIKTIVISVVFLFEVG